MNLREIWSIKTHKRILSIELCDLNGNSELEIICGFSDGYLEIFSMRGKHLKSIKISENEPLYHIKKFDFFRNGKSRLIIGGKDGILRIFDISLDLSFNLLWSLKFNSLIAGILIDDINNDGIYEIISYSLDKTFRVLNPKDGSLIWGQVFEKGISDCLIWSNYWKESDQENFKKELIACSNDGTLRSFDSNTGKLLWFKSFTEKMRCLSWIPRKEGDFILCGGDDKQIHIINKNSQKIVKNISLSNYVWNSISHFEKKNYRAIFSTYSFQHFLDSKTTHEIDFNSEIISIDSKGEIAWTKKGVNVEDLKIYNMKKKSILLVGDSLGNFILLDLKTGKYLLKNQSESTLNVISILQNRSMLILGYENGTIKLIKLKD